MKKSSKKTGKTSPWPQHRLSKSEWEILEILWEHGPLIASRVQELFAKRRKKRREKELTVGAIRAYLERMAGKEFVAKDPDGAITRYKAVYTCDALVRKEITELADRCFGGDVVELIADALRVKRMTPENLKRLTKILNELGKQR